MIQKKICLLGAFAVGKTSLVSRFVSGIFSEQYLTTIGVKIDKKQVDLGGQSINLVIWDLAGEDAFTRVEASYLRGTSGYFLVVDSTRGNTLLRALELRDRVAVMLPGVPTMLLVNKVDKTDQWDLDSNALDRVMVAGLPVQRVSARLGDGVEGAFEGLTRAMLGV